MNFREGMRRLGILLGAAGGIMGGFLAFVPTFGNAPGVWTTLTAHRKFEAALASPTMLKVVKGFVPPPRFVPPPLSSYEGPARADQFGGIPLDGSGERPAKGSQKAPPPGVTFTDVDPSQVGVWVDTVPQDGGTTVEDANPLLKGNLDGIRSVHFDSTSRVASILFTSGEWVFRTEAPKFSEYLLLFAFPFAGFMLPWSAIRLLTWVGTGFFSPRA